ncbi:GCD complex subunit gcd7 [Cladophialophora chaetospira]|uniref:Translation initiation factor eIF2B subunit beta n=1 Tax=Cladophialophora chaetospira TaxID=386627 RepID=A0AA38WYJ2_9EURO|nr:GCD complex subunit gcd7 [Cladophialophora chaetospira]
MAAAVPSTPGFTSFQKVLSTETLESATAYLVSLLKRRQVRGSKRCAVVTTLLLLRTVETTKQADSERLIQRVKDVGKKLINAAPHEPAVGNIVRRVISIIREEDEEDATGQRGGGDASPAGDESDFGTPTPLESSQIRSSLFHNLPNGISSSSPSPQRGPSGARPPLLTTRTGTPESAARPITSMFSINAHPTMRHLGGLDSPSNRSGSGTPQMGTSGLLPNLRPEVIHGIKEIIDEINAADDEIAAAALDQIYPQETIFTYSSSLTVQRFLLRAASKRKFTVIHAEAYPNNHRQTHALLTGNQDAIAEDEDNLPNDTFTKTLTSAGITVVVIPDSAIFAVMSRASKVILDAHAVLEDGSIIAAAGSKTVVKAAKFHRKPVMVLAATYKLSPAYPYDPFRLIEYGDAGRVVAFQDGELWKGLDSGAKNALHDFVEAAEIDLFVTNQVPAVVSTGYLYRVVREQYDEEDVEL